MTVRIARATLRDLPRLLAFERLVFPKDAYPREMFVDLLADCGDLFFLARAAGELAGYAVSCAGNGKAELVSIAVDPKLRRAGIGRALLERTLTALRAAGAGRVELMVRDDNADAIGFYRRFGFRRLGRARRYYEDGADALRMQLRLAADDAVQTPRSRSRHRQV